MSRDFDKWILTLKDSISSWRYYTDFDKVYDNVKNASSQLELLNTLVNSQDIENDFRELVKKHPKVLKIIPLLLAKRDSVVKVITENETKVFNFEKINMSIDDYVLFMRETGLFDLLSNNRISNLIDYLHGIEVGLDSNARKNRTGTTMEEIVESHIQNLGFEKGISYFPQMKASHVRDLFHIDVTGLDKEKKAEKVFDFIVKTKDYVYGIEVNFYSGGGSKLNETARSFKNIALESKDIKGFKFIWITDGIGWLTAKSNLQETFVVHDLVFNLNDLEVGLLKETLI